MKKFCLILSVILTAIAVNAQEHKSYFSKRAVLPFPSCFTDGDQAKRLGMDCVATLQMTDVAMSVMPDEGVMAVFAGVAPGAADTTYVTVTRRHGSEVWNMPVTSVSRPECMPVAKTQVDSLALALGADMDHFAAVKTNDGILHAIICKNGAAIEIATDPDKTMDAKNATASLSEAGYYCLNGTVNETYPDGKQKYEATYENGRPIGIETRWREDGTKDWYWSRDGESGMWVTFRTSGIISHVSRWQLSVDLSGYGEELCPGYNAHGYSWEYDGAGMQVEAYRFRHGVQDGSVKQGENSAVITTN